MKTLIHILALFICGVFSAQQNLELTTLRMGSYKIFMKIEDAEKIATRKIINYEDWDKSDVVKYQGEDIKIKLQNTYISEEETSHLSIYMLSTKSPRFRTKSGMGVGNTRDELIEAYKKYPNFSVSQGWDDKNNKNSNKESYFNLTDQEAGTELSFKMINNVVVEVTIYINEGC